MRKKSWPGLRASGASTKSIQWAATQKLHPVEADAVLNLPLSLTATTDALGNWAFSTFSLLNSLSCAHLKQMDFKNSI